MKGLSAMSTDNLVELRTALNLSANGILLFRCLRTETGTIQAFRLTLANQKAEQLTGLDTLATENLAPEDIFPHTVATEIWDHARYVVDTGDVFETQVSYPSPPNHNESWFTLSVQPYGDGIAVSLADITAQKQQSLLIESVLNGSINGMLACEALRQEPAGTGAVYDLRIRLANEAASRMLGSPISQLVGSSLLTQYPGNLETGLFERYVQIIETGEPQRIETHYTFDGLNAWYDILVSKLGDGLLLTFVDTTVSKQNQQELQKTIDDLQRSNQSLERFAYVASHDLQEPLRKIQSFGDMLSQQPEGVLSAYSIGLINRMQTAADRMHTLIRDLLTYSRLSSQTQPFVPVNLQQTLQMVLNDLELTIQDKQATLELTSLPVVMGDALQLQQVFQNLLTNALKFVKVPDGSKKTNGYRPHIRIDCQRLTGQEIHALPGQTVSMADQDKFFFAISIADNGIGFDEKYLDRIFTIFQRLHTRNTYQGTGIGLAIVQKVIENHNGYLNAQSQPGEGATFTLYLPDEPAAMTLEGLLDGY
jgi:signal transduction histidine kinase